LEFVELHDIVGLGMPLLMESHVDERERNVTGESPMKLGGRDVRLWMCEGKIQESKKRERGSKKTDKNCINKTFSDGGSWEFRVSNACQLRHSATQTSQSKELR